MFLKFPKNFPNVVHDGENVRTFWMCHLGTSLAHCFSSFWILLTRYIVITLLGILQRKFQMSHSGTIRGTFFGKIQGFPMLFLIGTSQSHDLVNCKCTEHFLSMSHSGTSRVLSLGNSKFLHGFPNWDILVTWSGKLWMYQAFSSNEPLGNVVGTFFGKFWNVPIDYLIGTSQSHHWEHCECTGHFLHWGNCRKIGWDIWRCTYSMLTGYVVSSSSQN